MNILCRLFHHNWKEDPENQFKKICTRINCYASKQAMYNKFTNEVTWTVVDIESSLDKLIEPRWKFWVHNKDN